MVKKKSGAIVFWILGAVMVLVFLLLDIARGRAFEFGTVQLFGIGLGLGIFLAGFFLLPRSAWRGRWLLTSGLIALAVFIFSGLLFEFTTGSHWLSFTLWGIGLGSGLPMIIAGYVIWKEVSLNLAIEVVLFIVFLIPFLVWISIQYLRIDLWYDEVYSLHWFVFVSLGRTVTDYNAPNNHIFFNLINNIYLKFLGIKTLMELTNVVYQIRLLMLAYALATCLYVYRTGRKYFGLFAAPSALLILVTTIPFYNFAVQVRGYGISILLVSMLIFYLWRFEEKTGFIDALVIITLGVFLIYTIPTNVYFLGSAAVFYLMAGAYRLKNRKNNPNTECFSTKLVFRSVLSGEKREALGNLVKQYREFVIVALIGSSALLSVFLYLPVQQQLSHNALIKNPTLFPYTVFTERLPITLMYFFSDRWLLLVLILVGLLWMVLSPRVSRTHFHAGIESDPDVPTYMTRRIIFLLVVLIMPFVFSFLHGYDPYDRVFGILIPVFVLLLAAGVQLIYRLSWDFPAKYYIFLAFFAIYCYGVFYFELQKRDEQILSDIKNGNISQDMYFNYYQARYHPMRVFKDFTEKYLSDTIPVHIYEWGDTQSIPLYVTKFLIRFNKISDAREIYINSHGQLHLISAYPYKLLQDVKKYYPRLECENINKELDFVDVMSCKCSKENGAWPGCPSVGAKYTPRYWYNW